jgi:hypothetical protein
MSAEQEAYYELAYYTLDLAVPEGARRDAAIHNWCTSVWEAFHDSHQAVAELLRRYEVI